MCHELYEERFRWTKADDELRDKETELDETAKQDDPELAEREELERV